MKLTLWEQDIRYEARAEGREEGRAEGRVEGKAEGIAEGKAAGIVEGKAELVLRLLGRFGDIPQALRERILSEENPNTLDTWFGFAMDAKSLSEAEEQILNSKA